MGFTLAELNETDVPDFVAALGGVFEAAPCVAEIAAAGRPYATVQALFAGLRSAVEGVDAARRHALLVGHPELAGPAARSRSIAPDSIAEQEAAGLDRLSEAEYARFEALNRTYRERFGLPFILCVKRHGRASLLRSFEARLASDPDTEQATAEAEMFRIAAIRLDSLVTGEGGLRTTGRLSTHVLDTAAGRPAEGVAVELLEWVSEGEAALVTRAVTNSDGRTDPPLIGGRPVPIATYELRFRIGDHFRRTGAGLQEPPFLDIVPVRFSVGDPEGHYHVPLVATPWSYQTYRGS
jgi:2-oxo-4-hydroxy-4-carboxy-5-ureidoimidazoline decarboxylase